MDLNSSKNFKRPAVFINWQGSERPKMILIYGQGDPEGAGAPCCQKGSGPVFKIGMVSLIQMG